MAPPRPSQATAKEAGIDWLAAFPTLFLGLAVTSAKHVSGSLERARRLCESTDNTRIGKPILIDALRPRALARRAHYVAKPTQSSFL
jgi:hypothetical protein